MKDVLDSEPFVLQAEMGLCKKALTLLRCAFNSLTEKHSQLIMNQVIAWILNLIHGSSFGWKKKMKKLILKETVWMQLEIKRISSKKASNISLNGFNLHQRIEKAHLELWMFSNKAFSNLVWELENSNHVKRWQQFMNVLRFTSKLNVNPKS